MRKYTDKVEAEIMERYCTGETMVSLAAEYGCSRITIAKMRDRLGIVSLGARGKRTHKLNEKAFSGCPLSSEQAYWVGFLLGDGSVSSVYGTVSLGLQIADIDHIDKFLKFLSADYPIVVRKTTTGYDSSAEYATVQVYSKRLADSLICLGVAPRKSLAAKPNCEFANNRDFWRGMVDADGWVSDNRKENGNWMPAIGLCGSLDCVSGFRDYCLSIVPRCVTQATKDKTIFRFNIVGRYATKVADRLYADAPVSLSRKLATFETFASWIPRRNGGGRNASLDEMQRLFSEYGNWKDVAQCLGIKIESLRSRLCRLRKSHKLGGSQ